MATFSYSNTHQVVFTYGGTTGNATTTAGQRLNSLWFKSFDYALSSLLPVKLQDFTATARQASVDLKWTASNQVNFNHFELQRSTDGKTFKEYAIILTSDNAGSPVNYNYTDKNLDNSTRFFYYRLKMVDVSGKMSYSQVQIILLEDNKDAVSIVAYPNPATNQLLVTMPTGWHGNKAIAQIYTASGLMVKSIQFSNISQTEKIEVPS